MLPVLIGIEGCSLTEDEIQCIQRVQPAGFILFSRNVESVEQVRALTSHLRSLCFHHPIIAMDQEGGRVVRTGALDWFLPSAGAVQKFGNSQDISTFARLTAHGLRYLGVNLNMAPVLDICYDETVNNALPSRCWGNNAQDVISNAGVFMRQHIYYGTSCCGKHFPGMGRALCDPHFDLPRIDLSESELQVSDMLPFMALCPELPAVMTAHIMMPQFDDKWPVTLSPVILHRLLRDLIGYKGIVFTDDLCMGAITKLVSISEACRLSWLAGCDIPLVCHDSLLYLDAITKVYQSIDDLERLTLEKRIERFTKTLMYPFVDNGVFWDELRKESFTFCEKFQQNATKNSSPVANY